MTVRDKTNLISGTERDNRVSETNSWTVEQAREKASKMGLELTDEHIEFLNCLRSIYVEHGWDMPAHELTKMVDEKFASHGGLKQLHMMFPDGPVTQGAELAGLKVPPYAEDTGFGSAQ